MRAQVLQGCRRSPLGAAGRAGATGQADGPSGWGTQGVHTPYIRDPRTDGAGEMVKGAGGFGRSYSVFVVEM